MKTVTQVHGPCWVRVPFIGWQTVVQKMIRDLPPPFRLLPSLISIVIFFAFMDKLLRQFQTFLHKKPTLGKNVYIAKGAVLFGDVTIGDHSSIWYNAVA